MKYPQISPSKSGFAVYRGAVYRGAVYWSFTVIKSTAEVRGGGVEMLNLIYFSQNFFLVYFSRKLVYNCLCWGAFKKRNKFADAISEQPLTNNYIMKCNVIIGDPLLEVTVPCLQVSEEGTTTVIVQPVGCVIYTKHVSGLFLLTKK